MIEPKAILALSPTIGLATQVIVHLLMTWGAPFGNLYRRLLVSALCGMATAGGLTWFVAGRLEWSTLQALAFVAFTAGTSAVLSFGYFNFVQLNVSSLRVRIAEELAVVAEGMAVDDLVERYGAHEIVRQRLERLSRGRQIIQRDGRYYHCWSVVYVVACCMDTCKRVVFGRRIRDNFRHGPPRT